MHRGTPPARRRAVVLAVAVLLAMCAALLGGCKSVNEVNTTEATSTVEGKTVDATMTPSGKIPTGVWPKKVGTFAASFKGPTWYPTKIPSTMKTVSLDALEMEPGSGLVCDIVYSDGTKYIELMQGSPKGRSYTIASSGKVAWGSAKADLVRDDPGNANSPTTIVYSAPGTLAELSGDVGIEQLKTIAASMVFVGSRRP